MALRLASDKLSMAKQEGEVFYPFLYFVGESQSDDEVSWLQMIN